MRKDGPLQLTLHLLEFCKMDHFAVSGLRRAWSLEAFDIPELEAVLRVKQSFRASVLGAGVPEAAADSVPAREAVLNVVDRLEALFARGAAFDVRASDAENGIPESALVPRWQAHTRLVLDAVWSSSAPGRLAVKLEVVDGWGIIGDDAEAFRDLVDAIRSCCSDPGRSPALTIHDDFQSHDRAARSCEQKSARPNT